MENNSNTFQENYNDSNLAEDRYEVNYTDTAFNGYDQGRSGMGAYSSGQVLAKQVKNVNKADAQAFGKYGLITLIYAILHTFCLYENTDGITYPIYILGTLLLIAWARKRDGLSIFTDKNGKAGLNLFYIISLMLLSVSKCTTANPELLWLDGFAINLLMFSFLIHMYADTKGFDLIGWIIAIMITMLMPVAKIAEPVNDFAAWIKTHGKADNSNKKANIVAVVTGLCISMPLLFAVIALLSSADAVFSNTLEKTFDFIFEFDYLWDIFAIAWMMLLSVWLFYTVIKNLCKRGIEVDTGKKTSFNPVIAITFTSMLSIVYLFFSIIQIFGLFMGKMTLPENYTYAEYAHEGFYQLLAVSIMNLVLVTLCQRLFKENVVLKVLLMVVGFCTYIMIISSAFRMLMYIGAYHLTFMRVFVLWFLGVLALWLSYLLVSLVYEKLPVFNLCMITVTVMYIAFVFANPDYHIAKYDLQYLESAIEKDDDYSMKSYFINDISMDAAPAFAGNKALLKEFGNNMYDWRNTEPRTLIQKIRRFNFSRYRAQSLVDSVSDK
ncbi:DUF4153 domain-containing protein [Butyrivibrio sp. JL13D10]|uniref:DUF4153 domain-containing protein n=1 Tax=Butyrivibrio sp. JL13D10 TaxID=3236815 RepID=UPI0038B45044